MAPDERQPSCFGLEKEKGEGWKGSGAMNPAINEKRPTPVSVKKNKVVNPIDRESA
jgi:hypothetical protein